MPNDMSHFDTPASPDTITRLASLTSRYCARGQALVLDPALTMETAAAALDHLAGLQNDLASERLRQCRPSSAEMQRVESQFKPLEETLKAARADLSCALLRAEPGESDLFGMVPHRREPNPVIEEENDPTPKAIGTPRAVSACQALVDLEALRPYLSHHALRQAIANYSKNTGCHDVRGVAYAALPASAYLPCDIL